MNRLSRRAFVRRYGLGIFLAMSAGYSFCIERYLFQVNRYRIPVPRLPSSFEGFTFTQLSDLHFGPLMPLAVIRRVIRRANDLHSDAILCTGDYIHARDATDQVDAVWTELMKLKARFGVFSVLGNHDHWGNTERSLDWLEKSGQSVRHRAMPVEINGSRIWVGGAGDFWEDVPGIDRAFRGIPAEECKILLAHNPDTADSTYNTALDLIVSGHTHGGQVVVPFWGPPVLPVKNKHYSSGLIEHKGKKVFISRGIGWAIIPVRLNCRPEICVLELVRADGRTDAGTG